MIVTRTAGRLADETITKRLYHATNTRLSTVSGRTSAGREEGEEGRRAAMETDEVGPPCARSNLRPVRYSARLWNHGAWSGTTADESRPLTTRRSQHPYSLQEFRPSPADMPSGLAALRARLEVQDIHWTLLRTRADKLNQAFWEHQSSHFEALELSQKTHILHQESPPGVVVDNIPLSVQERLDSALDLFYAQWLVDQKSQFQKYNRAWWALQPALLKAGWLAQIRNLKWKLACWRYAILPVK